MNTYVSATIAAERRHQLIEQASQSRRSRIAGRDKGAQARSHRIARRHLAVA
jgi:hypothetical protein